jgi:hypothetical protein
LSNNGFDNDINLWQSYIEDDKNVKDVNLTLYKTIKDRISKEYETEIPLYFDDILDKFIQKTFAYSSELQLSTFTD